MTHPLGPLAYFVYLLGDSVTMAIATSSSHPSWGEVGQKFLYLKKKKVVSVQGEAARKKKKEGFYLQAGPGFSSQTNGVSEEGI